MSLISLPFDCLYDITSFLDLHAVRSLLLTCTSLHGQMTASDHAKFIWMNQLNYYLMAEIAYLKLPENQKKTVKITRQLCKQLKNQEELLRRFESRSRTHHDMDSSDDDEDNQIDDADEVFSRQYAVFSIYNSLKQLFYSGVIRRLRTNMIKILKRMRDAQSIEEMFQLFEEAVKNNNLSAFTSDASEEQEEELMRIQRQETILWNTKNNSKTFLFYFVSGILLRSKEDLSVNSEDADSLMQRIILLLKQLVNQYHIDASEEGNGQAPLLLIIKMKNLQLLKEFIPLHNQGIIQNKTTQQNLLFNSAVRTEDTLMSSIPLSVAIKEFVSLDMIDLILEEVYEPNRKEMLVSILGSRPAYHNECYHSIFDYKLPWIQSIIEEYQIEISSISEHAFTCAVISKSSSKPFELIQYLYSRGLRMKPVVDQENQYYYSINDPFLSLLEPHRSTEELEIIQCMELLLDAGGSVSHLPVFDYLTSDRFTFKMFQFLSNHGADPNKISSRTWSSNIPPLLIVISNFSYSEGNYEKVRWFIECGADPTLFFFSHDQYYHNTYMSALRIAYHRYEIMSPNSEILDTITQLLAEYGVTKETEKPDPDGLTFDQWFEVASQE